MATFISGIQQVGIGIPDVHEAFKWYRQNFGMDIPVFDDEGTAALMLPYTDGKPQDRHAILAVNIQGGGGFEIWQYKSRTPQLPAFDIQLGDLGFYAAKIKSRNVKATFELFQKRGLKLHGGLVSDPRGAAHFFVEDPYGNIFQVVGSNNWFSNRKGVLTGGPTGVIIGVSNIEQSMAFYSNILGYDAVVYDKTDVFPEFGNLDGGHKKYRRVLLGHSKPRQGAFSRMFGISEVELVEAIDYQPRKIFENRLWGDRGFIHLCFDIINMDDMRKLCSHKGFPFTVDTGESFDMGEAAGRFAYTEDPDGALIEFVETFKLPIAKKLGWYLDLRKRDALKPLPNWMLKSMALGRVKD